MKKINVLILAGQREGVEDPLLANSNVRYKALLPILGRPMIDYVISALDLSQNLSKPYWLSGISKEFTDHNLLQAPSGEGPASSVILSAETCIKPPFLITTCDHALLSSEIIDEFLQKSVQSGADFTVALAEREIIEKKYPNVRRTYLKFSDKTVSGCNLFFVRNENGLEAIRFWSMAESDRKKPIKLAARVGFSLLLQYISGRLSLDNAFNNVSKRLEIKAKPIIIPFAQAAIDVDKPSDLKLVTQIIKGEI